MVRKLVLAVAAAGALMSSNMVQALGVGEINLRSALNQPLEAEIELLQVRDLSSTEIRSVLASPDDFGRAGIDRSFFLTDLTFTPVVQPNGKAYIKVTSNRPVKEPYLNFLMEVRWPSGRVLREFTLLLDPPLYDPTPVTFSAPITPPATASAPIVRPAATAPARAPAPAVTPAARSSAPSTPAASDGQRRTTRSDTLWGIALETRPQGSSVHQTMLAIQDLNPNAFIGDNINALKAGQTLTLPTAEQAAERSQAEAIAEVGNQNQAWQNRQRSSEPAQRQLDARERSVAGEAPAQTRQEDTLRLVAGTSTDSSDDSLSASGGADGGLRDTLDQTKEQLDSSERAKAELTDRLADVEGQLETLQRLLTLKDAQLAALQRELAEEGELPDILPVPEEEAQAAAENAEADADQAAQLLADQAGNGETLELGEAAVTGDASETTETTETAEALDAESAAELVAQEDQQEDGSQDVGENDEEQLALVPGASPAEQNAANNTTPPAAPETPAPAAPVAPQVQPEASSSTPEQLLQRFMQNQTLLLATGAVALLVLLLILMSIARRNARREAELTENYLAQQAGSAAPAADEGEDFNVALADVQEQGEPDEQDEGEFIDGLIEADELIAEGRLDDAAEVLHEAIQEEPERTDLRLKMMEVEARRENQPGYAAQLTTLQSMGVSDSAIEMMNARYPLMAAGLLTGAGLLSDDAEAELTDEDALAQPLLDDADIFSEPVAEEPSDFDFTDFGLEEDTAASLATDSDQEEVGFDLDFDLDDLNLDAAPAQTEAESEADTVAEDAFADLEFDAPLSESPLSEPVEDDFSLQLDDELQADSLMAEFEAMSLSGDSEVQPEAAEAEQDDGFNLTDDDLAGFEAQLQSVMQSEAVEADPEAGETVEQSEPAGQSMQVDTGIDFDIPDTVSEDLMSEGLDEDFDFLADTDECATKLDLARAYIDMGDEEGARDILAEVVEEGNDQQQQDARELMEQLG